ncbi:aldehyde dehydrogenase (plasmid) [Rhizobium grahamii]|uniref:Aldehyde dehydrogenase n=1 Tax=Rhizobium grahamii TaxID=1120045 RepID=A0A5Q0CEZ6_9HYPH|nr:MULTISPECIES: aldehyde dehydrogenase [Rhizobium]QFY62690.1 aldehyde dehydrogenase [Rhizobium grahamii]QRM52567.1 aldehyde dehydrogenase [Rhizobium sp. BG6]
MFDVRTEISPRLLDSFFIDGDWVRASGPNTKSLISPSTGQSIAEVSLATPQEVDLAIVAARSAFESGPWPRLTAAERADYMLRLAEALERRTTVFVNLWTAQVGAPISLASRLVPLAVARLRYFAGLATTYAFEKDRPTARGHARIVAEPVGPAALIIPWNAALPILMNKLGAALAAGCTCVIKPSPESPLDAYLVAECAREASLPPGVINVVLADNDGSARLVASPDIAKVSFTGSVGTGSQIGAVVSARMGRLTLEMGGKSAAIFLPDGDVEQAMPTLEQFTMPFSGQFCFSQTRILVPKAREAEISEAYAARVAAFKVGDPWEPDTRVGPVLNRRQFDKAMSYITQGIQDGAEVVTGGRADTRQPTGNYILPTVFRNVTREMSIAKEEIFGPVVTIQAYEDEDDAVAIANDTDFGLSGSIFGNPERAFAVARRIRTGQVHINGMELAPSAPFGGFKMSGIGREGGPEGLEAFLETKAILFPSTAI